VAFLWNRSPTPATPPSRRAAPPAPGRRGPALAQQLTERIRAIAVESGAPEDAIEPSLRAILEGIGARAGAVCLYDPQKLLLRLVAEVGLSDEGCRSLRNIRQGVMSAWDMPLQSLLSHRVFLIDNPAENRYVPPLVDDQKAVETIACLPLYDGPNPVGSLVLVAMKPTGFGDEHIHALKGPQRELVTMIEALRRRAGQTRAPEHPTPSADAGPGAASGATVAPVVVTAPSSATPAPTGAGPEQAAEIQRLLVQLAESRVAAAAQEQAIATAKRARDEQTVEIGRLRAELAEAKAALAASVDEVAATRRRESTEREAEVARLRAELSRAETATAARERDLGTEIERLRARLGAAESTATSREQELLTTWQSERDSLAAEARALRATLTETTTAASRAEEELSAARRERDSLAAELERERARAAALESEAASHVRDHAAAAEQLQQLHARLTDTDGGRSRDAAQIADLERRVAALTDRITAAATREESLGMEMAARLGAAGVQEDALRTELEARARTVEQREAELDEARQTALAADRALADSRAETETIRAALAEATASIEIMRTTIAQLEDTRERWLDSEPAAANASPASPDDAQDVARLTIDEPLLVHVSAPAATVEPIGATAEDQPTGAASFAAAPPPSHDSTAAASGLQAKSTHTGAAARASNDTRFAIIDVEASWQGIRIDRQRATIVAPDVASSLAANLPPDPIFVNLAAPGALAAVVALRDAGVISRFLAYVAAAGTGKALRLGTTEVLSGPMDPDAVLAALTSHIARGTRVLAAGADADAVMSLRQALSRQGASVSMAWDSNQARDLLAMTKPAVAVIDLELPPRDGYALVATLADLSPVPTAVLISQTMDGAARFAAEAGDRSRAARLISLEEVLRDLLRPA